MEDLSKDLPQGNIIKEGDTVIIYEDIQTSTIVKLTLSGTFDNRFGKFHHKDIIGKQYGSKITSKKGYVYVLRPTPTLITQSLPHRTQILYSVDISMIILKLDIKPGSQVVETGTGSGSLSSSLATAIGPTGHLYTYEFNKDRYDKVKLEFKTLGFTNITVTWRDTCKDGFKPMEGDNFTLPPIDAVFLDLPKPWEAIPHAKEVLKVGGRICCFSPCIEQVQKNCLKLEEEGFIEIRTFEFIARNYERKKNNFKRLEENFNRKRTRKELDKENPEDQKFKEAQKELKEAQAEAEKELQEGQAGAEKEQNKNQMAVESNKDIYYYTSGSQYAQGHTGYLTFAIKHISKSNK
jgi:tRNA(1-methyladenosine) methyltransferase and related methyltransferases